jgi:hypothetical protein
LTGKNPSRTGFSSVRPSSLVSSFSLLKSPFECDDPCAGSTKEFDLEFEFGLTTSTPTMPSPTLPFLDPSSNGVTTSIPPGSISISVSISVIEVGFDNLIRSSSYLKASSIQRNTGGQVVHIDQVGMGQ